MADLPGPHGLYRPDFEHDACGVAFVVDMQGRRTPSHGAHGDRQPLPPGAPGRVRRRGQHRRRRRDPDPGARRASTAAVSRLPAARRGLRHRHRLPARRRRRGRGSPRPAIDKIVASEGLACSAGATCPIDDSMIGATPGPSMPSRSASSSSVAAPTRRDRASTSSGGRSSLRKRIEHEVDGRLLPVPVVPHPRLQGHAHHAAAGDVLPRPRRRAGRVRPGPGALPLLDQHLPVAGRWPTPTATSPTTARSTPCRATATGCGPARRCCAATLLARRPRAHLPDLHARTPATRPASTRCSSCCTSAAGSLPHAVLMMIPEAWENHAHDGPGPAGLLPVPRAR